MAHTFTNPLRQLLGRTVEVDAKCNHCGYDLRGLKYGSPCPECGTPVSGFAKVHYTSTLTDAPASYLRQLLLGCFLMLIAGVGLCVSMVLSRTVGGTVSDAIGWLFPLPSGLLWLAGVWIVTQPRQPGVPEKVDHNAEWKRLRVVVRWSQAMWIVAFIAFASAIAAYNTANAAAIAAQNNPATANTPIGQLTPVTFTTPPITYVLKWVGALAMGAAFLGLPALLLYLVNLAYWAADITLGQRLSLAALAVAGGLPMALIGFGLGPVLGSVYTSKFSTPNTIVSIVTVGGTAMAGFAMLVLGIGVLQGAWALASFANMSRWALKNSAEQRASDRRRSDNINKRIRDNMMKPSARSARERDPDPSRPHAPADAQQRGVITVQPPSTGVMPFDLAPDTGDSRLPSPPPQAPVRHPPSRATPPRRTREPGPRD